MNIETVQKAHEEAVVKLRELQEEVQRYRDLKESETALMRRMIRSIHALTGTLKLIYDRGVIPADILPLVEKILKP